MPDVWTTNPKKLRTVFEELGAPCGIEARVLKPRDSEWTCHIDSKGWLRDVYIHHVSGVYQYVSFYAPVTVVFVIGILLGLAWGKRFWRKAPGTGDFA